MNAKKYNIVSLVAFFVILILFLLITIIVDPFFHYHKPWLNYRLDAGHRYVTDGIMKNFEYDAIIIGSSLTENFKTTQFDDLFDVDSIKTPLPDATYKETADRLDRALNSENEIKCIIRCLDSKYLVCDKDTYAYDWYPEYLYDDYLYNDVHYILNKEVFFNYSIENIKHSLQRKESVSFDDYAATVRNNLTLELIQSNGYVRLTIEEERKWNLQDEQLMLGNLEQNIIRLAKDYPYTDFYLYFPPNPIIWWDQMQRTGELEWYITAEEKASQQLVKYENIHLFSFHDKYEVVFNIENYSDHIHYGPEINEYILQWMAKEERLTEENYKEYYDEIRDFYSSYAYDELLGEQ